MIKKKILYYLFILCKYTRSVGQPGRQTAQTREDNKMILQMLFLVYYLKRNKCDACTV